MARFLQDTWFQELLAIIISVLAYLSILILFIVYDGKPDFQWHGLTLNATISILSTTSRLLLLITIAACIGQLRWNAFSRRRTPVSHMETWDNASRGALGCFDLLWKTRSWSIAAIGAWLTILAVGFEPSIQQALRFVPDFRIVSSDIDQLATIQSARSWAGGRLEGSSHQVTIIPSINDTSGSIGGALGVYTAATLDFSMLSAIYNGLVATPPQISQSVPYTCSSGHCNWESYLSLAVCSACHDVHDEIETRQATADDNLYSFNYYWTDYDTAITSFTGTVFILPNGLPIWNVPGFPDQALITTKTVSRWSETLRFKSNNTLIFATTILKASSPQNDSLTLSQITARECGLYFCVRSYISKVANGTLDEHATEVSSIMDPESFQITPSNTTPYSGPEVPDVIYDPNDGSYAHREDIRIMPPEADTSKFGSQDLTISQDGAAALIDQAFKIFDGASIGAALPRNMSIGGGGRKTQEFGEVFEPAAIQTLYNSKDIDQTFANLANSLSNDMRRNSRTQQTQTGQALSPVSLVHIRWGWVAFSGTIIVVGVAFLLTCILLTRRVRIPLWKTSALVTLFHRIQPWPLVPASEKLSTHEMTQLSKGWSGMLGPDHTLELTNGPTEVTKEEEKVSKQNTHDSGKASLQEISPQRTTHSDNSVERTSEV